MQRIQAVSLRSATAGTVEIRSNRHATFTPLWKGKLLALAAGLAWLPFGHGAQTATNWVAYNDYNRGAGTAANVTSYSPSGPGTAGGPLTDFLTGAALPNQVGVDITVVGSVSGAYGSTWGPNTGSPAALIFGGKIDWDTSAFYFAANPYDAAVTFMFTNLTPGATYSFRGTMVRGNQYAGRWTLVTLQGASSAVPVHLTGTGSPGIITNGWAPYGDAMIPDLQAAFNAGENRMGDVIGWDRIIPEGTSFSVICSNYHTLVASGAPVPKAGGGTATVENTYCYALEAIELSEVRYSPTEEIVMTQPPMSTNVVRESSV